jgi:S-adenosyl methyltransferase
VSGLPYGSTTTSRDYDYFLGGKDNYAADREAALALTAAIPGAPRAARDNRAFLGRAVQFLTAEAVRNWISASACPPGARPRDRLEPGTVSKVRVREAAVRDAPGHLFPLANHPAPAVRNKRPVSSADWPSGIDGIPRDDVKGADARHKSFQGVNRTAVIPLADSSDRQS